MYWTQLYLFSLSGALFLGTVLKIFKLHPFFLLIFFIIICGIWWKWQCDYGEISPSLKEVYLKGGIVFSVVIGLCLGVILK